MGAASTDEMMSDALRQHQAGRLAEAEKLYRQVLRQDPAHAGALHLLGVIAHQVGEHTSAVDLIKKAIRVNPGVADYHNNVAEALRALGRLDEALAHYRRAIELDPHALAAAVNLGAALQLKNRAAEAIEIFRAAAAAHPGDVSVQVNLGVALAREGHTDDAIKAFQQALRLDPRSVEAEVNLGLTFHLLGRHEEAIAALRRAVLLDPRSAAAQQTLGLALLAVGDVAGAIAADRAAIAARPDNPRPHSNLLMALHYDDRITPTELFDEHLRWAKRHADPLTRAAAQPHPNDRDPDRRLRIGYVSGDFRLHSVAFFLEPILAAHDRGMVEIVCYSSVSYPDDVTRRLSRLADQWRDVTTLSDVQLADAIRADRIDILIDLAGHTDGGRLLTFARRPAPVQATYLGYPDTTGMSAIDYRITDARADPPGAEALCSERLVRLPRCAWCYRPPDPSPDVSALPALGPDVITFGSFNNLAKVSATTIDLWAGVLRSIPGARLLLKGGPLAGESVRRQVADALAARGIAANRLILRGRDASIADHLVAYREIDIALDTFPYHGTTTTCDALWMGVPIVTMQGETHASRVGASLLNAVGLDELVAATPPQFMRIATQLAADRQRLAALRQALRPRLRASSLMDAPSLARALEQAYRTMWRTWCGAAV